MSFASSMAEHATAERGGERGILVGRTFNPNPPPPPTDVLRQSIRLREVPTRHRPRQSLSERVAHFLIRRGLMVGDETLQARLRVYDALDFLIASLAPERSDRRKGRVTAVDMRHPYHLRHALDLLPRIPDNCGHERRFMELLLNRALRAYAERMSQTKQFAFTFEAEAKEFFVQGMKIERQIRRITEPSEKMQAMQLLNDCYFHGRYYYYFSILCREKQETDSRMHIWYVRAGFFLARIDWRGEIVQKPNPRALPSRSAVLFLMRRDKSVMERCRADPAFKLKIKRLVDCHPKG